ncbi:MAG: hypothetical protein IKU25_05515 [Clostridia bacterium]|nr:hypothetical protein [Clostridia bacterium]
MYVLKDLWYGNVSPIERYVRSDSEYRALLIKSGDVIDEFVCGLPTDKVEKWEKVRELLQKMSMLEEEDAFVCGFRLGAKMIMDVFEEYKGQFNRFSEV